LQRCLIIGGHSCPFVVIGDSVVRRIAAEFVAQAVVPAPEGILARHTEPAALKDAPKRQ